MDRNKGIIEAYFENLLYLQVFTLEKYNMLYKIYVVKITVMHFQNLYLFKDLMFFEKWTILWTRICPEN